MTNHYPPQECMRCRKVRRIRGYFLCDGCYTWASRHPEANPYEPTLWERFVDFALETQRDWIKEMREA